MGQYQAWLEAAELLIEDWRSSARIPRIEKPLLHRWVSADARESHTVIAWRNDAFQASWCGRIHDVVREACVSDRSVWKYQRPFYEQVFASVFGARDAAFVFNAVVVTPTRQPRHQWPKSGRPALIEHFEPKAIQRPRREIRKPLELVVRTTTLKIPIENIVWAERPIEVRRGLQVMEAVSHRQWLSHRMSFTRLFEANHEADVADLMSNTVPALGEAMVEIDGVDRTHAPMIQLWRLDKLGWMCVVNLVLSRDSGRMVDLRQSRWSFEAVMKQDPYFAPALVETLAVGQPLFSR